MQMTHMELLATATRLILLQWIPAWCVQLNNAFEHSLSKQAAMASSCNSFEPTAYRQALPGVEQEDHFEAVV